MCRLSVVAMVCLSACTSGPASVATRPLARETLWRVTPSIGIGNLHFDPSGFDDSDLTIAEAEARIGVELVNQLEPYVLFGFSLIDDSDDGVDVEAEGYATGLGARLYFTDRRIRVRPFIEWDFGVQWYDVDLRVGSLDDDDVDSTIFGGFGFGVLGRLTEGFSIEIGGRFRGSELDLFGDDDVEVGTFTGYLGGGFHF